MASVTIRGRQDVVRRLGAIPIAIIRRPVAVEALVAAGGIYRDDVEARAPRRTGQLKASVAVSAQAGTRNTVRAKVFIRRRAYYWFFVEHGTSKMPAQPFIRPAFDENSDKVVQDYARRLKAADMVGDAVRSVG